MKHFDIAAWRQANPGLGITVSEESVRQRMQAETDRLNEREEEARRALDEGDYLAWVQKFMQDEINRLNERYGDLLPEGVRFEWAPSDAVAE